jgi:hypothetical protein
MKLTTNQKVAVGLVILAVLTVLILWWTGIIFKSKFRRTKRSGMNFGNNSSFGRINDRSRFGAINRRSRFGAIGGNLEGDMTHRIQTSVTYKNPDNFGLWYSPGTAGQAQSTAAKFVGLMFHMSSTTNNDGFNASTDNVTNARSDVTTKDPVNYGTLTDSNDFFTNVYSDALATYYGEYPATSATVSADYTTYVNANEVTHYVVQLAVNAAFNGNSPVSALAGYTVNNVTTLFENDVVYSGAGTPNYDLVIAECARLSTLLNAFVSNNKISSSESSTEGIWTDTTGKASTGGDSVSIKTTQNLDWLSKPYGDFTFGVAIVNAALTIDGSSKYVFPLSVSDLNIANAHVSGLPSVSNSPTGLSVTVTYY